MNRLQENTPPRVARAVFLLIVATGCANPEPPARTPAPTPTPSSAPIAYASPVEDWPGFDHHLSREGRVYFGGQPTADALRAALQHGISTIVNLRLPREMTQRVDYDEPGLARELDLEYVAIPITRATFSVKDADRLAEILERAAANPDPNGGGVLIHCASSNRCGALWGLYLIRHHDMSLDEALEHGRHAGLRSEAASQMLRDAAAAAASPAP